MKRQILFRGYSESLNKWVEGDLVQCDGLQKWILPIETNDLIDIIPVHPDSVGQFTGEMWYDIKIWEGDIFNPIYGESGVIVFVDGAFMVKTTNNLYHLKECIKECAFTITGNTFQQK